MSPQTPQQWINPPLSSSARLNWTGIILEHYRQPRVCLPECAINWHTLSIVQSHPGDTRVAVNKSWQRQPAKSGELWILPAEQITQSQWDGEIEYFRLLIEPQWFNSLAATMTRHPRCNLELKLQLFDPLIHHMVLALYAELVNNPDQSQFYADALTHALGVHLLQKYTSGNRYLQDNRNLSTSEFTARLGDRLQSYPKRIRLSRESPKPKSLAKNY